LGGAFLRRIGGPHCSAWGSFFQSTCNDPIESGDLFGASICAGDFDGTGRAPGRGRPWRDGAAGMVHVIAPWRQNLPASIARLAPTASNPVFSVKPFDEVCIASTTKAMTALIACERTQLPTSDPKYVSLDAYYTVPDWIRNNVGGSLYMFKKSERLQLRDLLYACIFPSGNDAAYAIADMLTGGNNPWLGYDSTCPVSWRDEPAGAAARHDAHRLTIPRPTWGIITDRVRHGASAGCHGQLAPGPPWWAPRTQLHADPKDSNNNTISGSKPAVVRLPADAQSRNRPSAA
jgi:hypothetical protein